MKKKNQDHDKKDEINSHQINNYDIAVIVISDNLLMVLKYT